MRGAIQGKKDFTEIPCSAHTTFLGKRNIPNAAPKSSLFTCTEVAFFHNFIGCKILHVLFIELLTIHFQSWH